MYGVVLMAALSVGSATPGWGCHGCWGGGCWGGCWGGRGCWGGCWGGGGSCCGCYGGYGGCYGCYGGNGCWGSGYGGSACYGGYYSAYASYYGRSPYFPAVAPAYVPGSMPTYTPPAAPEPIPPPKSTSVPSPARLIVDLPADAKLYVDGHVMKSSSARREFATPKLEPGEAYFYELRAEVTRDGKAIDRKQRVIVRAGEISKVSFADMDRLSAAPAVARLQR